MVIMIVKIITVVVFKVKINTNIKLFACSKLSSDDDNGDSDGGDDKVE